jgi:hypothetical protein
MATNITSSFITQWSTEVKQAYQQKKSKLREAVRMVSGVTGSQHKFHTLGSVTANTKTRDQDVTPLNPTQGVATATLTDYYAPIYIDNLDELKTNADFRREFVMAGASALGRQTDDLIIAAMDASSTSLTTNTTGALTYAKIVEALEVLNNSDVEPEDRYLVVGPKQISDALGITQLTSADYMQVKNVVQGEVGNALGFKWIMSTRLTDPGSPIDRDCYAFSKTAIGMAVGQDVKTRIDYSVDKAAHLVLSSMSMGSVVIEAAGNVKVPCDES